MKLMKIRMRNRIEQSSLSYLMKIAFETPEKLSDSVLDAIISVWNSQIRYYTSQQDFSSDITTIYFRILLPDILELDF